MANKIIDPDYLVRSSSLGNLGIDGNIWIDYPTLKIYLAEWTQANGASVEQELLTYEGVEIQTVWSYISEEYNNDVDFSKFDIPMDLITETKVDLVDGWQWGNLTTIQLLRDGGFAYKDPTDGFYTKQYANVSGLSAFAEATDQAYYINVAGGTPIQMDLPNKFNQAVLIFELVGSANTDAGFNFASVNTLVTVVDLTGVFSVGDKFIVRKSTENNGTYTVQAITSGLITIEENWIATGADAATELWEFNDYRNKIVFYLREYQKKYASHDILVEQDKLELTYREYGVPLKNEIDIKITHNDVTVAGYGITMTIRDTPLMIDFGSGAKPFTITIDGQGRVSEEIYEGVQLLLRDTNNINQNFASTGNYRGDTFPELMAFEGDTLKTKKTTLGGVYIQNFHSDDTNTIVYYDDNGSANEFPFVATGAIVPNLLLMQDPLAKFWMYHAVTPAGNYGTVDALLVDGGSGVKLTSSGLSFAAHAIAAASGLDIFAEGDKVFVLGSTNNDGLWTVGAGGTASNLPIVETMVATGADAVSIELSTKKITGLIAGRSSIPFTVDFDTNTQGGRTAGPTYPIPIVLIAKGITIAKPVKLEATIERIVGNNFRVSSTVERNYKNN